MKSEYVSKKWMSCVNSGVRCSARNEMNSCFQAINPCRDCIKEFLFWKSYNEVKGK